MEANTDKDLTDEESYPSIHASVSINSEDTIAEKPKAVLTATTIQSVNGYNYFNNRCFSVLVNEYHISEDTLKKICDIVYDCQKKVRKIGFSKIINILIRDSFYLVTNDIYFKFHYIFITTLFLLNDYYLLFFIVCYCWKYPSLSDKEFYDILNKIIDYIDKTLNTDEEEIHKKKPLEDMVFISLRNNLGPCSIKLEDIAVLVDNYKTINFDILLDGISSHEINNRKWALNKILLMHVFSNAAQHCIDNNAIRDMIDFSSILYMPSYISLDSLKLNEKY